MLYIPKIDNYLKILTDEKVIDFVAINFSECFKSIREEQNLRKASKLNSSDNCIHHYNVKILNLFDPELQLINTKPVIKSKLKGLLSKLKKFKV